MGTINQRQNRTLWIQTAGLAAVLAIGYGTLQWIWPPLAEELRGQVGYRVISPLENQFWWLLSPSFLIVLGVSLVLQKLIPAKPEQSTLNAGVVNDFVWFFYSGIALALITAVYVSGLSTLYTNHFDFLTITSANQLPAWARFLIAILLFDFLYWLMHLAQHKISFLWPFHAVHHEQRDLNFFTDFRIHPVSFLLTEGSVAIAFFILAMDVPTVVLFAYFRALYSKFYHSNIKLNLGPLRYILVTPQSHRVHHSLLPEHCDMNYGAMFSIWDFAFGTQVKDFDIYPDTGSWDENFPHEEAALSPLTLVTPLIQILYPFRVVGRALVSAVKPAKRETKSENSPVP